MFNVGNYVEITGQFGCFSSYIHFLNIYNLPTDNFGSSITLGNYEVIFIGQHGVKQAYVLKNIIDGIKYLMSNEYNEIKLVQSNQVTQSNQSKSNELEDKWWLPYYYGLPNK